MQTIRTMIASLLVVLATTTAYADPVKTEYETRVGKLEFINSFPTQETTDKLREARRYHRATQAYIWALPIVSMADFVFTFKANLNMEYGQFIRLNTYEDLSFGITANATTDYLVSWINLAEDTWVLEVPPGAAAGFLQDMWQRPVVDLGIPGPNKGKGGKFLFLGPDQKEPNDTKGYRVLRSVNNNAFVLFRILEVDPKRKAEMSSGIRLYPYAERKTPRQTVIEAPGGREWSSNQPRGLAYWERLSWIIDQEPMHERDGFMMAFLKDLGIEKGKPFEPTPEMAALLKEASLVGESMTKALDWNNELDVVHYAEGSKWGNAIAVGITQRQPGYFEMDERAAWFYEALTSSKGMKSTTPGVGSAYLGGYKDNDGDWLDGAKNYKLNVPKNAPAARFWSVTVYHNDTRYLIQNEQQIADKSSRMDLDKNEDGSVDIYFGPKAPKGKEKNWIPTNPGEGWFSYFRLYGPTQDHFDLKWVLPDIEKATWD